MTVADREQYGCAPREFEPAIWNHGQVRGAIYKASRLSRRRSPSRPNNNTSRSSFRVMHLLKIIFLTIVNLAKQVWLLPQTVALALQRRRRQPAQDDLETERLDRLRNPSKYLGR
jgi:hypothetical protein